MKDINKFFGVKDKYCIFDNKGGGDCFFLAIAKAVHTLDNNTMSSLSKTKLRKLVADNFNRYGQIKSLFQQTDDPQSLSDLSLKFDKNGNLVSQQKYKKYIKTKQYWADTLTISILEEKLPLKFIILSNDSDRGNLHLSATATEKPIDGLKYIILMKDDVHYVLVGLKEPRQLIFDLEDLPNEVKTNPDFQNYIRVSSRENRQKKQGEKTQKEKGKEKEKAKDKAKEKKSPLKTTSSKSSQTKKAPDFLSEEALTFMLQEASKVPSVQKENKKEKKKDKKHLSPYQHDDENIPKDLYSHWNKYPLPTKKPTYLTPVQKEKKKESKQENKKENIKDKKKEKEYLSPVRKKYSLPVVSRKSSVPSKRKIHKNIIRKPKRTTNIRNKTSQKKKKEIEIIQIDSD